MPYPTAYDLERHYKEKTMGRPINSRYFGANSANNIKVQFHNGTASVAGYIVKQKGSKRFLCRAADGSEAICTLAAKASAALQVGEMTVSVKTDSGIVSQVTKITAHKVVANGVEYAWTFDGSATDARVQIEEAGVITEPVPATPFDPTDDILVDSTDLEGDGA